jgi:hypothetical protein
MHKLNIGCMKKVIRNLRICFSRNFFKELVEEVEQLNENIIMISHKIQHHLNLPLLQVQLHIIIPKLLALVNQVIWDLL